MVKSLGYCGMGYCDRDGDWRDAFRNRLLIGPIYLIE